VDGIEEHNRETRKENNTTTSDRVGELRLEARGVYLVHYYEQKRCPKWVVRGMICILMARD